MTVSPCEALINLRGRWLGGDRGLGPCADEDYGSISCGGEGTPQTFLPAIKATWLSSVALGKEKKRSPLRKEINSVLYAWQEIKTGITRREQLGFYAASHGHGEWQGPAAALGRVPSAQGWKSQCKGLSPFPGAGLEPPQMSHRQDQLLVTQGPALRRVPCLAERSAITALNFLRLFEQGACGFVLHWAPQMM